MAPDVERIIRSKMILKRVAFEALFMLAINTFSAAFLLGILALLGKYLGQFPQPGDMAKYLIWSGVGLASGPVMIGCFLIPMWYYRLKRAERIERV